MSLQNFEFHYGADIHVIRPATGFVSIDLRDRILVGHSDGTLVTMTQAMANHAKYAIDAIYSYFPSKLDPAAHDIRPNLGVVEVGAGCQVPNVLVMVVIYFANRGPWPLVVRIHVHGGVAANELTPPSMSVRANCLSKFSVLMKFDTGVHANVSHES